MVRLFIISEPQVRDSITSRARPKLASQTPKVRSKMLIMAAFIEAPTKTKGASKTRLNIIPSKDNRAINKCVS